MKCWLYLGEVLHRRVKPVVNAFRYRVFFLKFPLHRVAELSNAVFAVDRFNLLSFHHADHGDGADLLTWARALLAREGVSDADGEIWLQCFPRVLGYVFNPVSFFFCHRADGRLRAIVAQVNNTFGERHCYLLEASAPAGVEPLIRNGQLLTARKVFHVSPFCAIEGGYRFRFLETGASGLETGASGLEARTPGAAAPRRNVARIDYHDAAGDLILTSISGAAQPFTAAALAGAFVRHPMMTFGVVVRIHWQALRLWLKRVPFHRKPAPPSQFVTR